MTNGMQCSGRISKVVARAATAAPMFILALLALVSVVTQCAPAQSYTTLHRFTGGRDGRFPVGSLILDDAGNLYGETFVGGDFNCGWRPGGCGVVFKIDTAYHETVLHTFEGTDGAFPSGGLVRDSVGNLYGVTYGMEKGSTVFKMDATGKQTVLYMFPSDGRKGEAPEGALVRDRVGNLYGTTSYGGNLSCNVGQPYTSCGVVFKLNKAGTQTVLHRFNGRDGATPTAGVILDPNGNLYGTTLRGGTNDAGTVFKLDKIGKLTVLHRFEGGVSDGFGPGAPLIRDADGNLYGTTQTGGSFNAGIVFKIDTTGKETILHHFNGGADGWGPFGGVIRDAAGNLYGTTKFGGDLACDGIGCGTIFKLDVNGTKTVLHAFKGKPGKRPTAGLVMDASGILYGTTSGDYNVNNYGTVFKLVP